MERDYYQTRVMDARQRSNYPFCSAPEDNAGCLPEQPKSSGVPPRKKPRFSDESLHASAVADTPQHPFFKTRLCTRFQLGSCIYGANCHYAHGTQELRQNVPGLQHYHHHQQQQQSFKIGNSSVPNLKNIYWKTKLCNKWEATGCCLYAERCQYAHGHAELRKPGSMETDWINIEVSAPKSSFTFSKDDHPLPHGSVFSCDTQQQEQQQQPQQQEQEQHQQPHSQEQRQIQWRELKRNSRIYGDWINDIPVVSPPEGRDVEI